MFKDWKRKRHQRKLTKRFRQLHGLLIAIDQLMFKEGWTRQERRRLWREFYKSDANRERIMDSLIGIMK